MSFTVSQILVAALRNPSLVTSETAAYVVLSLAEQCQAAPRRVCAEHVLLHPPGAITIGDVPQCSAAENDALLRELLGRLLSCSSQATVSEALTRVVNGVAQGPVTLRTELQTALVPLNRGAARRALSRLCRKLGTLTDLERADSDEQSWDGASPTQGRSVCIGAIEEIPVVVDETAFRVVSRETQPPPVESRSVPSNSDVGCVTVSWHPAQTTPRLFSDGAVASDEGTPILGSLPVRLREVSRGEVGTSAPESSRDSWSESAPQCDDAVVEALDPADEWNDTVVDAAVDAVEVATGRLGLDTKRITRRNTRRSAVNHLVQRIAATNRGIEQARESLLEIVNHVADDAEFSLGSATPPPVAQQTPSRPRDIARQGTRRIVLTTLAIGAASAGAWVMRPTEVTTHRDAASPTLASPCEVQVHVEVPAEARVFLNDSRDRAAQGGPLARFDGVQCGAQAELTVQLPGPGGSPLPDAWVRMPLPEAELRAAARSSQPFRVSPLGENR